MGLAEARTQKTEATKEYLIQAACVQTATAATGNAAREGVAAQEAVAAARAAGTLRGWKKKQLYKTVAAAKAEFKSSKKTCDKLKEATTALKTIAERTC